MKRGEIYRTQEKIPERGYKPGFYVVVSRDFVAHNEDIATVICAPIYGEILGLRSEMVVGPANGLPRDSAIRCDFLTLMFKSRLKHFVGSLTPGQIGELSSALRYALDL
jgi:mRNA interferase MazF